MIKRQIPTKNDLDECKKKFEKSEFMDNVGLATNDGRPCQQDINELS